MKVTKEQANGLTMMLASLIFMTVFFGAVFLIKEQLDEFKDYFIIPLTLILLVCTWVFLLGLFKLAEHFIKKTYE